MEDYLPTANVTQFEENVYFLGPLGSFVWVPFAIILFGFFIFFTYSFIVFHAANKEKYEARRNRLIAEKCTIDEIVASYSMETVHDILPKPRLRPFALKMNLDRVLREIWRCYGANPRRLHAMLVKQMRAQMQQLTENKQPNPGGEGNNPTTGSSATESPQSGQPVLPKDQQVIHQQPQSQRVLQEQQETPPPRPPPPPQAKPILLQRQRRLSCSSTGPEIVDNYVNPSFHYTRRIPGTPPLTKRNLPQPMFRKAASFSTAGERPRNSVTFKNVVTAVQSRGVPEFVGRKNSLGQLPRAGSIVGEHAGQPMTNQHPLMGDLLGGNQQGLGGGFVNKPNFNQPLLPLSMFSGLDLSAYDTKNTPSPDNSPVDPDIDCDNDFVSESRRSTSKTSDSGKNFKSVFMMHGYMKKH